MMAERGKDAPEETGVLHLDPKTNGVVGQAKTEDNPIGFFLKRGVRLSTPDQKLAQTIGRKYNVAMPKQSTDTHLYRAKHGSHFLVALLTTLSRSTYSWAEPIED
jgi:hypothetical protein